MVASDTLAQELDKLPEYVMLRALVAKRNIFNAVIVNFD